MLEVPRSTLQAWRASQERLDECPAVVAFFHSVPGLAFLHRLVVAIHLVCTDVGACGIRLVCLLVQRTGLDRCVGASYGAPPQVNRQVEEAIVAYRHEERARLAHEMPAKEIPMTQDETLTGGLCVVGIEPKSTDMLLAHPAAARDQATWQPRMEPALAGLNCRVIQSTSDEAPGLLASVAHHLGAPHAPDVFHVQHALRKAVSAPMATKERAAAKAEETCKRVHEPLDNASDAPAQRGSGRPPKGAVSLEQVVQDVEATRQEPQRLSGQRMAGDIQRHIDTIRTSAPHEHLSETCMERLEKAERVVPTMQATIAFVSG